MNLRTTKVFKQIKAAYDNPLYNVIAIHGGTRSSKTYSTIQFLIFQCLMNPGVTITVTGKSMNWLKRGPERDFVEILRDIKYYSVDRHNLSNHTYTFANDSMIEFLSTEDEEKLKGPGRFIVFCNEGNSLSQGAFLQLAGRTKNKILIDYNPSFRKDHWLHKTLADEKTASLHSTYLDNPFLSKIQKEHITNMIKYDINYYRIYVLGLAAIDIDRIYNHFKEYTEIPKDEEVILTSYGLDFGFNDPTALVEVKKTKTGKYYIKELIYESGLTSTDLIQRLKDLKIEGNIYCDTARPEIITEMIRAKFNAMKANKSIKAGIDSIRSSEIYLHKDSLNLWNEVENYLWKQVSNILTDEPIDKFNHLLDALRYCIHIIKDITNVGNRYKSYVV